MTKTSRGAKLLHLSKNPYQAKKQSQVHGLSILQKQIKDNVPLQNSNVNTVKEQPLDMDRIVRTDEPNNNIYILFQELLLGLEVIKNSFEYYSKNYLLKVISTIENNDIDYITKYNSFNEAISIFLTLQTEYNNLYNNKVQECNKYESDAKTQFLFKSKNNYLYALFMFAKKSSGNKYWKQLKKIPKFRTMQYERRFELACNEIQNNFIIASKYFIDFINKDYLQLNISANRSSGYVELDIKKYKGSNIKDFIESLTKKNMLAIINNDWKITDESALYKSYLQTAEVIKEVRIHVQSPKCIIKAKIIKTPPSSTTNYNLNELCAVVSAQKEITNDINNSLQSEHVNDSTESTYQLQSAPVQIGEVLDDCTESTSQKVPIILNNKVCKR
jgi:hypothetical protein